MMRERVHVGLEGVLVDAVGVVEDEACAQARKWNKRDGVIE
jgi:hypothetical protein